VSCVTFGQLLIEFTGMFKVECPGCKAPYQVDERRILRAD